jgi:predicted transcriptional regulator
MDSGNKTLITLTAEITAAHVSHNKVDPAEVGLVIERVHGALSDCGKQEELIEEKVPVVSVRGSIRPGYLVCMECGAKQKMLKRHLQAVHQMTPDQYRKDYGLPGSYPMVAAEYAERRRKIANQTGLGRKGRDGVEASTELLDRPQS